MSSSVHPHRPPAAASVALDADRIRLEMVDGRELTVPIAWFDWLERATADERADFVLLQGGGGIWWDRLDEGLSVPALLGVPEFGTTTGR